jgi:phospholipid-binding lipoprotein MlaA
VTAGTPSPRPRRPRPTALALALVAGALASGCATVGPPPAGDGLKVPAAAPANPADPWESWNRRVFAFNDAVDTALLRPVAEAYAEVVPSPARQAVGNFFGNFGDAWSVVNHLLQGKWEGALTSLVRVTTNSVFGLGGLIDIATEAGIDRESEDLGQTLGAWGVGSGPYVVLPLFGPSTLRDTVTWVPDRYVSPSLLVDGTGARAALTATNVIDTRASLLQATRMLDSIALDRYSFVRDAYLQRRLNQVYDGNPPEPPEPPDDTEAQNDGPAARPAPGQPAPAPAR